MQREVPEAINILAATCAKETKGKSIVTCLDMGGEDEPISNDLIELCDIISPNETELQRLLAASDKKEDGNGEGNDEGALGDQSSNNQDDRIMEMMQQINPGLMLLLK